MSGMMIKDAGLSYFSVTGAALVTNVCTFGQAANSVSAMSLAANNTRGIWIHELTISCTGGPCAIYTGTTLSPSYGAGQQIIAQIVAGQSLVLRDIFLPPGYGVWFSTGAGCTGNATIMFDI